jgi:hypothetical protein
MRGEGGEGRCTRQERMIKLEASLRPRRRRMVATRRGIMGDIFRRWCSKWGARIIHPISKQGVDALAVLRERPKIQNSLVLVSSHAVRRSEEVNVRLLLPPVGRSKETRFFCSLRDFVHPVGYVTTASWWIERGVEEEGVGNRRRSLTVCSTDAIPCSIQNDL